MACVVKRGAALGVRRAALSFEDPRDRRFAGLHDIRHYRSRLPTQQDAQGYLNQSLGRRRNGHEEERVAE